MNVETAIADAYRRGNVAEFQRLAKTVGIERAHQIARSADVIRPSGEIVRVSQGGTMVPSQPRRRRARSSRSSAGPRHLEIVLSRAAEKTIRDDLFCRFDELSRGIETGGVLYAEPRHIGRDTLVVDVATTGGRRTRREPSHLVSGERSTRSFVPARWRSGLVTRSR